MQFTIESLVQLVINTTITVLAWYRSQKKTQAGNKMVLDVVQMSGQDEVNRIEKLEAELKGFQERFDRLEKTITERLLSDLATISEGLKNQEAIQKTTVKELLVMRNLLDQINLLKTANAKGN